MLGKFLGGLGRILIISGLVVLGFVGYQLWGTGIETARAQDDLTEGLAQGLADEEAPPQDGADDEVVDAATLDLSEVAERLAEIDPVTAPAIAPPPSGQAVGVIEIPRIGLERVIVEGVSKEDLKKGPGHYPGTAMPGQAGNAGIAGHRTTYGAPFNRIDELKPGDEIRVTTPQGRFVYEVIAADGSNSGQAWYAVPPTRVDVLEDVGDNRLTLTACHPKYSARERIIVHARLTAPPAATPAIVSVQRPEVSDVALDFDEGLEGDPDSLPRALAFGAAAAAVMILAWVLARYVRRSVVYLVATPGVLVLIWFGYVHMDRFLPAL